ncbi:hypothetical protein ACFLWY_00250 [Chloroflexota bacterium]
MPTKIILYFLSLVLLISGCSQSSQSGQSISDEEIIVSTKKMDVHFERVGDFSDTYMVFGGSDFSQTDIINKISISGIPMDKAISIYKRYPDFNECKSPGAALAQNALLDFHIIPVDSEILNVLKNVISQHEKYFKNDGDRIFVKLEGEALKMTSAIMREWNADVMDQLPAQTRHGYYLVKSAEIIEARSVFEGF